MKDKEFVFRDDRKGGLNLSFSNSNIFVCNCIQTNHAKSSLFTTFFKTAPVEYRNM